MLRDAVTGKAGRWRMSCYSSNSIMVFAPVVLILQSEGCMVLAPIAAVGSARQGPILASTAFIRCIAPPSHYLCSKGLDH